MWLRSRRGSRDLVSCLNVPFVYLRALGGYTPFAKPQRTRRYTKEFCIKTVFRIRRKFFPVATARERAHSPQSTSDIFLRRDRRSPSHPRTPQHDATRVHRST